MVKLLNNWSLKLIALAAAVILWFVVIAVENTVYKYPQEVQVKAANISSNLSLSNELPQVTLFLRVDRNTLKAIAPSDFEIFIDLEGVEAGETTLPIEVTTKNPTANILKIEPSEVDVRLTPTTEKEVEVRVIVQGEPASGYLIESTEPETDTARISGSQAILESIEYLEATVILEGIETDTISQSAPISLPDEVELGSELITIDPEERSVQVVIASELAEKEVPVVPRFAREGDQTEWENQITIDPATITIRGSSELIDQLDSIPTANIESALVRRGTTIDVSLDIPGGIATVGNITSVTIIPPEVDNEDDE